MSDWKRTTREVPFEGLTPEMVSAVKAHAVVTPRWLIWVVRSGNAPMAVLSTQFAKMVPDSGIQVNGMFTDVSENASAFIGLDDSVTAKKFKETVFKAVQDAKK